jgi:hypothetical protein
MSLQRRADDTPDLQVKQTFAQIAGEGNLFAGNKDNLQVVYSNIAGQENPLHVNNWRAIVNYAGSTTMIEPLKAYNDYRLFYYFAPMQALTDPLYLPEGESLLEDNDPDAYQGLDPTPTLGDTYSKISIKMFNRINDIYRNSFEGIPFIRLGYADMNFILAEAAERGWIDNPAKTYYEEGIRASFNFVRATVPDELIYTQGIYITDEYIDSYIRSEQVSYKTSGSSDERIRQIYTQSYFASFLHLQWDAYLEYRRTKYPEFPVNPETNQNDQTDKIPMRWLYPQGEINYNKEQMDIALQRQWSGIDNINNLMWILQ